MDITTGSYKNMGALALGLFWCTVVIIIHVLNGKKAGSISEHAASAKKIAIIFGGVSLLSAVLLVLFFVKWFTPTFQLGAVFNIIVLTMLILFAVAGVVPDGKGIKHKIHVITAIVASVLLLPAMVMIILNNHVSQAARVFAILAILTMFYTGYRFTASRHTENKLLIHEALYFLCFDVSVLVVAYIR